MGVHYLNNPTHPVAVSPKPYRDSRLSWQAKGVFAWLATASDEALDDAVAQLAAAGDGDAEAVHAALDELAACGYLVDGTLTDNPEPR